MALGGSHLGARAELAASRASKRSQTAGERGFAALQVVIGIALLLGLFAVLLPGIQGALSESLGCVSQRLAQALGGETGSADSCGSARVTAAAAGVAEASWAEAGQSGAWRAFAKPTGTAPPASVRVAQADATPRAGSSTLEAIRVRVRRDFPSQAPLAEQLPEAELRELLARAIVAGLDGGGGSLESKNPAKEEAVQTLLGLPSHVLVWAPRRIYLVRNIGDAPGFAGLEERVGPLRGAYNAGANEAVVETRPPPGWARSGRAPKWWWRARYSLSLEKHVLLHEVGHAVQEILRGFYGLRVPEPFRGALLTDLHNPNPPPLDTQDYEYRSPEILAYFDQEPWEAFADSFAWYHSNPQALQRTWPNLFRYWADNPIERALRDLRR